LSEAGWKSGPFSTVAPDEVTADDFKKVLANMPGLFIRGEFNTGSDTGSLDNVRFGVPK